MPIEFMLCFFVSGARLLEPTKKQPAEKTPTAELSSVGVFIDVSLFPP
jgi:hypothetical protein